MNSSPCFRLSGSESGLFGLEESTARTAAEGGNLCDFIRLTAGYFPGEKYLEGTAESPLGLEENRARARTEAKRLKFSLFEQGNLRLPSEFEDFSGADGLASDFLHSLDLFGSFLDPSQK